MRFRSFSLGLFVVLLVVVSLIDASSDPRQRFEGLIGKTVQAAWRQIDRQGFVSLKKSLGSNDISPLRLFRFSTRSDDGSDERKCSTLEQSDSSWRRTSDPQ